MGGDGSDVVTLQRSVAWTPPSPGDYDGREYTIRAASLDGEFDIGLSHRGAGAPPEEILPLDVYEPVRRAVLDRIALGHVQAATTENRWPDLGRCRLTVPESGTVEVTIELGTDWVIDDE